MSKIGSSGKPPLPPPPGPRPAGPKIQSPNISPSKVDTSQTQTDDSKKIQDQVPQPSSPRSGKKTTRTVASEAHAKSLQGQKTQIEDEQQKTLLSSVPSKADDKIATFRKGIVDKAKGEDAVVGNIKDAYGKAVAKDFKTARSSAKQELDALKQKQAQSKTGYLDKNDKEKLERLERLNQAFEKEPMHIAEEMSKHQDDPTYRFMGPAKFASLEVTTRDLVQASEKANGKSYKLSTMERVSIYGYTTQDFSDVNDKLRTGKLKEYPQYQSYVGHINSGLAKLDSFNGDKLYRGVRFAGLPEDVKKQYKPQGRLQDLAFTSTSSNSEAAFSGYDLKLTITNAGGKGGKILPFSAHAGEKEVLFPPGTQFEVLARTPMDVRLIPKNQNWTVDDIAKHEAQQNSWMVRIPDPPSSKRDAWQ